MADDDLNFEFEAHLEKKQLPATGGPVGMDQRVLVAIPPQELIGQQPGNYRKNFKKTVCTYWLRGMCMKGDACGFLHQYDVDRMPICRNLLKFGECKDIDCPYKHDTEEIKECNMYRLGFCIYGPQCRFKHKPLPGPPPPIEGLEAAKPKEVRDVSRVVNSVNPGVIEERDRSLRVRRAGDPPPGRDGWADQDSKRPRALTWGTAGGVGAPQPPSQPPPGQMQAGAGGEAGGWRGPDSRPPVPGPRPPPNPPPGPKPPDGPPPPQQAQPQQQDGMPQQQGAGGEQAGQQGPPQGMPSITPGGPGGMPPLMPGAGPMGPGSMGGPGFMGPAGMPGMGPPGMMGPGMMGGMLGPGMGPPGMGPMMNPALMMGMLPPNMMMPPF